MEAVVVVCIVILIVCWACYKRKLDKAVYGIAALEIFLQICAFISQNIGKNGVATFLAKIPDGLLVVVDKYTNGILYMIIAWLFILLMICFLIATIKTFFKR